MPTVSQNAGLYMPRYQILDDTQTGSYSRLTSPSQINVSNGESNIPLQQSQSVVKVLNVNDLLEIPSLPP
jgi:hypothetical protein